MNRREPIREPNGSLGSLGAGKRDRREGPSTRDAGDSRAKKGASTGASRRRGDANGRWTRSMETRTKQPAPSCVSARGALHAVVGKGEGRPQTPGAAARFSRRTTTTRRDRRARAPVPRRRARVRGSPGAKEAVPAREFQWREGPGAPAWTQTRAAPRRPDQTRGVRATSARARARACRTSPTKRPASVCALETRAEGEAHRPADRPALAPGDGRRGRPRAEASRGRAREGEGRSSCWRLRKAGETRCCMTDEDESSLRLTT